MILHVTSSSLTRSTTEVRDTSASPKRDMRLVASRALTVILLGAPMTELRFSWLSST